MKRITLLFVLFIGWGFLGTDFVPRVESYINQLADEEIARLEAETSALRAQIDALQSPTQAAAGLPLSTGMLVVAALVFIGIMVAFSIRGMWQVQQWHAAKEALTGAEAALRKAKHQRDTQQVILNQLMAEGPPAWEQPQRSTGGY